MDVAAHVDALRRSGEALATAADRAGLDAAVPTCPDWSVRDLVAHVSGVHRWAAAFVVTGRRTPTSSTEAAGYFEVVDDDALFAHYDTGLAALCAALTSADPDLECWTFLPAPSPLAFWARRQAHETTVHAVDAGFAAGAPPPVDAALAEDGVDELLYGFLGRSSTRFKGAPAFTLGLRATDVRRCWTVRVTPDAVEVDDGLDGTCRLTGSARDLYLFAWNRVPASSLSVEGDTRVLAQWAARSAIRWG